MDFLRSSNLRSTSALLTSSFSISLLMSALNLPPALAAAAFQDTYLVVDLFQVLVHLPEIVLFQLMDILADFPVVESAE